MDQTKPIQDHKFAFSVNQLSRNPNKKAEERKKYLDEYFTKLSKPKDRFEKLKMLQELLKQFPKDRVIRRMIDAELEANPDAPSEFLKAP